MSLRYALCALLTSQPMTGYDVYKHFEQSVGYVWHAPDSQIYPELRRMEADGLITGKDERWGTKGTKKRYSITPSGEQAFRAWMNETLDYPRERNPISLKTAYLEWASPEAARAQMRAHIEHYAALIIVWQDMIDAIHDHSNPVLAKRLENYPESEWPRIEGYKALAYEGMIERAQAEVRWAKRALTVIDDLA
ncbi:PadR family transcriptional regulator [Lysinibacter cavernae]|uniref:DNA-binding PadR family transcriptional regulator n=1 Tax=Lysinibacter cavernae TaxID=1640652 RepID=A0A7X5R081_9MICO|nr:PadR family transcriptional regulator [Lysinibacter cavernae]NIH53238.1 DNA-binding PadR family transcriptional regulator [Lysinibacter cavernae]